MSHPGTRKAWTKRARLKSLKKSDPCQHIESFRVAPSKVSLGHGALTFVGLSRHCFIIFPTIHCLIEPMSRAEGLAYKNMCIYTKAHIYIDMFAKNHMYV